MADIAKARAEVQKVVALLVGRFGHDEDVFRHLTLALDHLREAPPVKEEAVPEPVIATPELEEEAVTAPPPPPPPPEVEPIRTVGQRRYRR
jgi:hypothetical protein